MGVLDPMSALYFIVAHSAIASSLIMDADTEAESIFVTPTSLPPMLGASKAGLE